MPTPIIIIAGHPPRRRALMAAVQQAGFDARACPVDGVRRALEQAEFAVALVVCLDDAGRETAAWAVDEGRVQFGVPVFIHAAVRGDQAHMADLIALDADAFIEEPIDASAVANTLGEVIGGVDDSAAVLRRPRPDSDKTRVASQRAAEATSSEGDPAERGRRAGETTDPLPARGPWHRTLDRLEARMHREHEDAVVRADESADGIDLSSLGVDGIPPVDSQLEDEAAASGVRLRLSSLADQRAPAEVTAAAVTVDATHVFDATERLASGSADGTGGSPGTRDAKVFAQHLAGGQPPTMTETGDIARTDAVSLLWRLAVERYTGSVTFSRDGAPGEKRAWLVDGALVHAEGDAPSDRLVEGLVIRGRLAGAHARHARALRRPTLEAWLCSLVEVGYLKSREAEPALAEHLCRVVDATVAWRHGEWALGHGERSEEELDRPLPVVHVLLEGCRWRLPVAVLRERLGPETAAPCWAAALEPFPRRAPAERGAWHPHGVEETELMRWDGRRSLRELAAGSGVDPRRLFALVYVGRLTGALVVLPEPRRGFDEGAIDLDLLRIRERLALARAGDHRGLLGLSEEPTPEDVARAHAATRALISDAELEPSVRDRLNPEITELRAAIDAAAHELSGGPASLWPSPSTSRSCE
ncbi:MAG: hypothetical protein B7733_04315 [Myxococcales bacterium FL481]|nr:MAG: hypothetical protein B7733_04315 [Myxococcales bacterium FL481]